MIDHDTVFQAADRTNRRILRMGRAAAMVGGHRRDPAYRILWPRIADLPMMHPHPPVDPVLAWGRG